MPCNSDYLNQNTKEAELQRAAKLLVILHKKMKKKSPEWVTTAADTYYCTEEKVVPALCEEIRSLTKEQQDKIIYNGRDADCRKLADWFDEHDKADRERIKQEKADKKANDKRLADYQKKAKA